MAEILIVAEKIYTGSEVVENGYIYVKNGVVEDIGGGPVPEDLTFAALILGGEGRVAVPGLAVAATTAVYPVRHLRPTPMRRLELYKALGVDASFIASLPAIYELHLYGATTVFVEFHDASLPLKLTDSVGGIYGLAVHEEWGIRPPEAPPSLAGSVVVGSPLPLLENPPIFAPSMLEEPWNASQALRKYTRSSGLIKKGERAEIVVFDFSKPPGMLLDKAELDLNAIYKLGLRAESVISGSDVLVDGGEHLYIVDKHFKEARRLAREIGA